MGWGGAGLGAVGVERHVHTVALTVGGHREGGREAGRACAKARSVARSMAIVWRSMATAKYCNSEVWLGLRDAMAKYVHA